MRIYLFVKKFSPLNIDKIKVNLYYIPLQIFISMDNQIQGKLSSQFPFLYDKKMQSTVKCFSKSENAVKYVCCQKQCDKNPFMCQKNSECQCYHPKCARKQFNVLIKKMEQKIKPIYQIIQQSNSTINKIQQDLNKNYFNYTKQNIQKSIIEVCKTDLFAIQSSLLLKLAQKKKHNKIRSLTFYNILNNQSGVNANKNKHDLNFFKKEAQQKWNNLKNMIKLELDGIQESWKSYTLFYGTKVAREQQQILKIQALFQKEDIVRTKLLYRASQHNFQIDEFHNQCNGVKNNILILKTKENAILGAYTPLAWQYPKFQQVQCVPDISKQTFIFSLKNNQKLIQKNQKAGIRNSNQIAPQFGTQEVYDFGICSKANVVKGSFIYFRKNFVDYANIYLTDTQQNWNRFTNSKNNERQFLIQQWQVWQLSLQKKK